MLCNVVKFGTVSTTVTTTIQLIRLPFDGHSTAYHASPDVATYRTLIYPAFYVYHFSLSAATNTAMNFHFS